MSAPNWRDVFGSVVLDATNDMPSVEAIAEDGWFTRAMAEVAADAILAAIAERGYRLYRDHDMKYHSLPAGQSPYFRCSRCGHRDSDLGMPTISCDGPE